MKKLVIWNDGSNLLVADGITWEYENDKDWLVTIDESVFTPTSEVKPT